MTRTWARFLAAAIIPARPALTMTPRGPLAGPRRSLLPLPCLYHFGYFPFSRGIQSFRSFRMTAYLIAVSIFFQIGNFEYQLFASRLIGFQFSVKHEIVDIGRLQSQELGGLLNVKWFVYDFGHGFPPQFSLIFSLCLSR
jgi:hypothetical protein